MTSIMTINDSSSRRGRHNSLDLVEVPIDDESYKDEEYTGSDFNLNDFLNPSGEIIDSEYSNVEFWAGSRPRTTSTDSLKSLRNELSRFVGNRERGLSLEFSLLPTSLKEFDTDDALALPISDVEEASPYPKVEARRLHLKSMQFQGKSPRGQGSSTRWQQRPASASTDIGEKLKVHFKFIGANKALAKQQNKLNSTKKKLTLSKASGIKNKKVGVARSKAGKAGSQYQASNGRLMPTKPSCVVVTSSTHPTEYSSTHKLSSSPIKSEAISTLSAHHKIEANRVQSSLEASRSQNRIKLEGGSSRKIQPVASLNANKVHKQSRADLGSIFQRTLPKTIPKTLPKICFGVPRDPNAKLVGRYTIDQRRERVRRFLDKRKTRVWQKKVKYGCRKKLADSRPRVKGRFVPRAKQEALAKERNAESSSRSAGQNGSSTSGRKAGTKVETPKTGVSKYKHRSVPTFSPSSSSKTLAKANQSKAERELKYNSVSIASREKKQYISLDLDDIDKPDIE